MSTERTPNPRHRLTIKPHHLAGQPRLTIRRRHYDPITVTPAEALRLANDLIDTVERLEHTPTPSQRDSPHPR